MNTAINNCKCGAQTGMTREEAEQRIQEILSEERFKYKTANVFSNSYLAMMQYAWEVELHTLQRVLGLELTDVQKLRGESK